MNSHKFLELLGITGNFQGFAGNHREFVRNRREVARNSAGNHSGSSQEYRGTLAIPLDSFHSEIPALDNKHVFIS